MVMLGECSYVGRGYQTALIDDYPAIDRAAYVTGVGHSIWNGLDQHDAVALRALEEFFAGRPRRSATIRPRRTSRSFCAERKGSLACCGLPTPGEQTTTIQAALAVRAPGRRACPRSPARVRGRRRSVSGRSAARRSGRPAAPRVR